MSFALLFHVSSLTLVQVLIAIWDFLLCLICCDCFRGGRKRRVGRSRGGAY
jgi:hypothetical protein